MATWSADDPQLRASLVPDAWLAALAHSHGARLATDGDADPAIEQILDALHGRTT